MEKTGTLKNVNEFIWKMIVQCYYLLSPELASIKIVVPIASFLKEKMSIT